MEPTNERAAVLRRVATAPRRRALRGEPRASRARDQGEATRGVLYFPQVSRRSTRVRAFVQARLSMRGSDARRWCADTFRSARCHGLGRARRLCRENDITRGIELLERGQVIARGRRVRITDMHPTHRQCAHAVPTLRRFTGTAPLCRALEGEEWLFKRLALGSLTILPLSDARGRGDRLRCGGTCVHRAVVSYLTCGGASVRRHAE